MIAADNIPENRRLPKKEQDLFRSIVKFYEIKQYKKGLKAADSVLKKFPNHGETLAMKGLTLNCMDRKEEAYELVKSGLRNDVRSHVCWHVYGLIHRSDRNYAEAIKCYLNALRIDPDNNQILRDLSLLQVQMRDLKGFVETRNKLLSLKSNQRNNWIAYAVANHLAGKLNLAIRIIDEYFNSSTDSRERGYDDSELVLYKNMILEQSGRLEAALKHLNDEKDYVVDGLSWRTKRAGLLLRLGRYAEAREAFRALVRDNTENYHSQAGLQCAVLELDQETCAAMLQLKGCALPSTQLDLTDAQRSSLTALYDELLAEDPKSLTFQRAPLGFLVGEQFRSTVDAYMRKQISRGLPSLGSDLSCLYITIDPETGDKVCAKDPYDLKQNERFQTISSLVDTYIEHLRNPSKSTFPPPLSTSSAAMNGEATEGQKEEPPTTLLWALYLKVQLLEASGRLQEALQMIEECIRHTPTAIDMLQRKARLLKRAGDVGQAAEVMDAARQLDLADRYVNNKTTKYMLRAGRIEEAQSIISLFAKHEGDPQHNLFEMQCMWYELEWAASQYNLQQYGKALKKFTAVEKHFADFTEDQFDFHTYCIRKSTLRAYVEILRLEDEILAHEYYQKAARGTVACYLALLDRPKVELEGAEPDYSGMTAAERKKEKAKARKAAKKAEAQEAASREEAEKRKKKEFSQEQNAQVTGEEADGKGGNAAGAAGGKKKRSSCPTPIDDDPEGENLAAKDPLIEASSVISLITRHAAKVVDSHILAYDVAMKRRKPLLALQALLRGQRLRVNHPEVFYRTVHFLHSIQTQKEELLHHPTIAQVVSAEEAGLLQGHSNLLSYVQHFTKQAKVWSLEHRLAAAKGLALIGGDGGNIGNSNKEAAALIKKSIGDETVRGVNVSRLVEALKVLEHDLQEPASSIREFRQQCAQLFPLATAFQDLPPPPLPSSPR